MATTNARMQQRRDTAANWSTNNPTLLIGELGFESDTGAVKIGDGLTAWTGLEYLVAPRSSSSVVVAAIAGGTATDSIPLFRGAAVFSIQTDKAAWVRLYNSTSSSTADSGRSRNQDPSPGSGVLCEVITTGAETITLTPTPLALNAESPVSSNFPIRVTNDAGTDNVTVDISFVSLFN